MTRVQIETGVKKVLKHNKETYVSLHTGYFLIISYGEINHCLNRVILAAGDRVLTSISADAGFDTICNHIENRVRVFEQEVSRV